VSLQLAQQLLAAACPDPSTLGTYQPFGQSLVDSKGVACPGAINTALNSGDTAWVLASASLVLLMTPALAFFYGGMVRVKHVLAMLMQNFAAIAIVSVTWVIVGFSWAFGGTGQIYGGNHFDFLWNAHDVVPTLGSFQTTPTLAFVAFQATFAIITPALITGSTADRWKFGSFCTFVTIWSVVIYAPVAHWVFDGYGMLNRSLIPSSQGHFWAEDFAGGTVVHINAGVAGLVSCLLLGKRKEPGPGHNMVLTFIGASLLWVGWFGFNAGSAVTAGLQAGMAMTVTQIATAVASLTWMFVEWAHRGKPTVIGICSGAVAGLVAITPASGFVGPIGALVIGIACGVGCYWGATGLKHMFGYDDALDAFGVHAVGGIIGALLTGVFAVNEFSGHSGLLEGDVGQFINQFKGVGTVIVYDAIVTFIILKIVDVAVGLRVSEDVERDGLDLALHGEVVH
jgi:ammonium transporter, Amt family